MPRFSRSSKSKLKQCSKSLQQVFNEVVLHFDCSIITGFRDAEEQNNMYRTGRSQLKFPYGKHNSFPSMAVDVMAYKIDWHDRERASLFAGFVLGIAKSKGISIRWGGDWNQDWQVKDNLFDDLAHFEIMK